MDYNILIQGEIVLIMEDGSETACPLARSPVLRTYLFPSASEESWRYVHYEGLTTASKGCRID